MDLFLNTQPRSPRHPVTMQLRSGCNRFEMRYENVQRVALKSGQQRERGEAHQESGSKRNTRVSLCNLTLFNLVTATYCAYLHKVARLRGYLNYSHCRSAIVLRHIRVARIGSAWGDGKKKTEGIAVCADRTEKRREVMCRAIHTEAINIL